MRRTLFGEEERDALAKLWFWWMRRKARKAARRRLNTDWRGKCAWQRNIVRADGRELGWLTIVGEENGLGQRRARVVQNYPGFDHTRAQQWSDAQSWAVGLNGKWKRNEEELK